jgi:DNA-binding CsgD family transcriptional regulator
MLDRKIANDVRALAEVTTQAGSVRAYEVGVLEILRRRMGFDVAMFKRPDGVGEHGLDSAVARSCRPYWNQFRADAMPVLTVAGEQGGVAVDVDVLGTRGLERLSYYQRLMRPHGGTATAFVCLIRHGRVAGTLALGRTHGTFHDHELAQLRALAPTLSVCETAALAAPPILPPTIAVLTPRERQVLSHLPLGHSNAQIALALGSAERTVRNQLSSIYEKLGVGSRAAAAALCAELGLAR